MYTGNTARGFTLIEILVVIALLAVLAAVAAPNLLGKANDANRRSAGIQLEKVANAIELYRLETGRFPQKLDDLLERPQGLDRWAGPYLGKRSSLQDPWGNDLVYVLPGRAREFELFSDGPDGQAGGQGDDEDIHIGF